MELTQTDVTQDDLGVDSSHQSATETPGYSSTGSTGHSSSALRLRELTSLLGKSWKYEETKEKRTGLVYTGMIMGIYV